MIVLKVAPAESEPFDVTAGDGELSVGRSTACDITLPDRFLSRRHARVFATENGWHIEDLGSRNGTFVNGTRVDAPTPVKPGDIITLSASMISVGGSSERDTPSDITTDVPSTDRLLRSAAELLRQTGTPPPEAASADPAVLARYAARLALLNTIHQAMARSTALDELLDLLFDHIFDQFEPERTEVFMRCDDGSYTCVATRSKPGSVIRSLYSESLLSEVGDRAMAALVTDTRSDHRFAHAQSLVSAGVRCLLAAPLFAPDGAFGLIVLGSNAAVRQYTEEDLELLVTLASVTALRVRNLALTREAAERQRLERELSLARRIQVTLLPERLPEIAGYLLHGETRPSRGVSGDYYQVVERDNGRECVFGLADVSGKGISAAMLTGYLEAVATTSIEDGLPPHEIFNRVSSKLHRRTLPNQFATMFLASLAPENGIVRYASAGHSPGCLVRAGGSIEWLPSTGFPLGLMPDAAYALAEARLGTGDTLLVYSDGYTEAVDPKGEEFGQERLAEVCRRHHRAAPRELAHAIDRELEAFASGQPFIDDRTIVVVRRDG
jgi:serine phosphatase RsbU (regulator of sigma subunit)